MSWIDNISKPSTSKVSIHRFSLGEPPMIVPFLGFSWHERRAIDFSGLSNMHKHGVCPKSIGQFVIFQPFNSKVIQFYGTCSNTLVFQTNQVCWSILSMTTEYQPNWSLGKTPSVEPALQCQRENKTGHSRCHFDLDFDRCGTFCWKTTVLFTLSRAKNWKQPLLSF